jgi:hypothetical protein
LYFFVLCVLIYCHGVPIYVGAVEIANYTAYKNDRGTLGGGVFVLEHNDIIAVENPELAANCERL